MSFVNTYDPQDTSVDLDGNVTKVLTGMPLKVDQFTFYVYADGDRTAPVLVGTNKQSGDVHFVDFDKTLLFTGVGTYQYDVVEHIPTGATYDAATGKLVANYFFEDAVNNQITFRNFYKATATDGTNTYETKTVTNRTPEPPAEPTVPVEPTVPADPTVPSKPTGSTNPQTGDAANLNLWFTALVISCGGFIVAATCGRKKETEEV